MSVTHTGQPGPMITFRPLGRMVRRPNLAMDCSWLPHTCMTDTGSRPIPLTTRASAWLRARARSGSRNRSSAAAPRVVTSDIGRPRALDLGAHVVRHHVAFGFTQQLLVERHGLRDLVGGDLPDREPDVIENEVARLHRLVHDVEPGLPPHAEEVHDGHEAPHLDHSSRHSETHRYLPSVWRTGGPPPPPLGLSSQPPPFGSGAAGRG